MKKAIEFVLTCVLALPCMLIGYLAAWIINGLITGYRLQQK